MLKLDAGARAQIPLRASIQIGFVVVGEGEANGEPVRKYTAFSLKPQETCAIASRDGMELLLVGLPMLSA
mgnify:CR=1 FL=1